MTSKAYDFWMSLLFDVELRSNFASDPHGVLAQMELDDSDKNVFAQLDAYGLELDAAGRAQYLMSALCRAFPYTVACLGTASSTPQHLQRFLKRVPSFANTEERTQAFGGFLDGLVCENLWNAKPLLVEMVRAVHEFEMALVENTARCRQAVQAGEKPPQIEKFSSNAIKRQKLILPPFMLLCEMPLSFGVLGQALLMPKPENIWQRIKTGQGLELERLQAVAHGSTMPVTVLARAQVLGIQGQRGGAGGVAPLIHISHRKMELSGRKASIFQAIQGRQRLADFPSEMHRSLRQFLDAGFLALN